MSSSLMLATNLNRSELLFAQCSMTTKSTFDYKVYTRDNQKFVTKSNRSTEFVMLQKVM